MLSESAMLEGPVKKSHQDREGMKRPSCSDVLYAIQEALHGPERRYLNQTHPHWRTHEVCI